MTVWNDENECPVCKSTEIVLPYGPVDSPILIVGDCPDPKSNMDITYNIPFINRSAGYRSGTATGTILFQLLKAHRWDYNQFRRMYLWQHAPDKMECFQHGKLQVIKEAIGKKLILMIGPTSVKEFTGKNVSDVCGVKTQSEFLSAPIIPCLSLSAVFVSAGEVQLAIEKFVKLLEKIYE